MSFALTVKNFYRAEPLLCYSGHKGYHVYVWLTRPVEFPSDKQAQAKRFYATAQNMLLKGVKLETVDSQVIGDIKRLSRVPYTIHEKSCNPCVPIKFKHEPLLVANLEGYRKHGLNENFIKTCMKKTEKTRSRFIRVHHFENNGKLRPCIKAALKQNLEKHNGHQMRLAIAIEHLRAGYKPSEVAMLFQSQGDFKFEKSLYYVEDAQKKRYKPFKCETIRSLGFCLKDACPYFKRRLA